jgi:hypothetical protein
MTILARFLAVLALYLLMPACSYPKKARAVTAADLANPEATRIYNFMRSSDGHDEVRSDHLMDEATIAILDGRQACFDLTIRSEHAIDMHPSQWHVKVNGVEAQVAQVEDPEKEFWTNTVQRMETTYERTTPRGTTTVQRPVEYETTGGYAVRHARACAPLASRPDHVDLEVELPQENYRTDWGQRFSWRLL